jgi:pilus assembly protein CpaD
MLLFTLPVLAVAGCSQDFASVDDVYVPASTEERFPIQVLEAPVKMTVPARAGALASEDVSRIAAFARAMKAGASSPLVVSHPAGSARASAVSRQAVKVLVSEGVPRSKIHVASYDGKSDVVSLSFTRKAAATKPCGDWSENLALDQYNEPYPDFGCSVQNNSAAMAANPADFEEPRRMDPAYSMGRMPAMERYDSGAWSAGQ